MTDTLQIAAWIAGALLNALLTYEAFRGSERWWKIAIPAATTLGLIGMAVHRVGLAVA